MKKIKQVFSTEIFLIKLAFKADSRSTAIFMLLTCFQYTIPLLSAWIWSELIDQFIGIYNADFISVAVWLYLGIYLILQLLVSLFRGLSDILFHKVKNQTTYLLDRSIMEKVAEVDVAFFDDPKNHDALTAAQESGTYISGSVSTAIYYVIQIITLISALIMFLSKNWVVGMIYLCTYIPGVILSFNQKKKMDDFSMAKIPYEREKSYYKFILTGEYFAKELRLYNLVDRYKKKYNDLWNKLRREREKLFCRGALFLLIATLLTYVGLVFIIVFSVRSVILGSMTLGTLVLFISLSGEAGCRLKETLDGISFFSETITPRVERYTDFLKYENQFKYSGTNSVRKCPTIEFKNICFKYPGNDDYTIHNLNFKIDSGKKIALIGVNGAGKSTIVKLLLRFYEPESGQILIDGEDIHNYSHEALNSIFGVCFQSVSKYSLTLKENLALSNIHRSEDRDALLSAAEAAGADIIINMLPNGLDSDMTRNFNDQGEELSGGQWQKIALTRAFFRDAGVVILDEPSSALDPEAEDHIFASFKKLCKDRSGILISHRLSSVMMVDEIVIIENGTVIESGTHHDLIEMNGRYAELYHMQAEKYVGGTCNENSD